MENKVSEYHLNEFISFRLMQLSNQLNRQSVRILSKCSNLRLPEWRCLTVVSLNGPLQVGRIADTLSSDFGQVSKAVTALEKMNYVVTKRDTKDKRQVKVNATAAGLEEFEKVMPILGARQQLLRACVTSEEAEIVSSAIKKFREEVVNFEATIDLI